MTEYVQVLTTTAKQEEAQALARMLVERRLAACVQVVGPIVSTYGWQGQIETATEWQCMAKTRRDLYPAVEGAIRQVHAYEVPEILAVPIVAGHTAYLAWVDEMTAAAEKTDA